MESLELQNGVKAYFYLKKDPNMEKDTKRDVVVDNAAYTVVIGLCTHLGCIPAYHASEQLFKCACHGGELIQVEKIPLGLLQDLLIYLLLKQMEPNLFQVKKVQNTKK